MDEADLAQAQEDANLREAIARRKPTLKACGRCLYCNEAVPGGHLFCDADCGCEFERERAIRAAQGR